MNRIEGVAVKFNHAGAVIEVRLPEPYRHCDCFKYAEHELNLPIESVKTGGKSNYQGFYDTKGRFLSRKRAMRLVKKTGQELKTIEAGSDDVNTCDYLFSEDVW